MHYPNNYIAFDLETSGVQAPNDKILEIGALMVVNGVVVEERSWVLNHKITLKPEIIAINGITQEMVDAGVEPQKAYQEFLDMFKRSDNGLCTNLTHNGINFDIPFLIKELEQCGYPNTESLKADMQSRAIDTAVMVKSKKIGMKRLWCEDFHTYAKRVMNTRAYGVKFNLALCCDEHQIDRSGITLHRATADVFLTHLLFRKLIAE